MLLSASQRCFFIGKAEEKFLNLRKRLLFGLNIKL